MVERPLCRRIAKVLDTPSSTKLKLKLARSNGLAGKITRGDGTVCGFIAHPLRVTRLCGLVTLFLRGAGCVACLLTPTGS